MMKGFAQVSMSLVLALASSFAPDEIVREALAMEAVVVEYHHAKLDRYFMTASMLEETAVLNGRVGPEWSRTGRAFVAKGDSTTGYAPVCRFFGTDKLRIDGSRIGPTGHFYTSDAAECEHVRSAWPGTAADGKSYPAWTLETDRAFFVRPLAFGGCAAGEAPVTRFYSGSRNGDANHRYVVDADVRDAMLKQGWIAEGDVFCAKPHVYLVESPWPFGRVVTSAPPPGYSAVQPWGQAVADPRSPQAKSVEIDYLKLTCSIGGIDVLMEGDDYTDVPNEAIWGGEWERSTWFTNGSLPLTASLPATLTADGAMISVSRVDRIYHWWTRSWPRKTVSSGATNCRVEQRFRASPGTWIQIGLDWYESETGTKNTEALVSRWAQGDGSWQVLQVGQ